MTEVTATGPDAMITPDSLGIWSREQVDALRPVTDFVREQGSVPAIQLGHCGRKGSKRPRREGGDPMSPEEGGWAVGTPSGIPYPYEDVDPPATTELSVAEIRDLVDDFGRAASNAVAAGFEVVELHGAHGYLLHEFLSPVTNRRTDAYGGDYEGRTRFLREATAAVREAWPDDRPVFVRVSATDWLDDRDSWDLEQTKRLALDLAADGVDLLDVSSGGIHPDQRVPPYRAGYQVPLAEAVRNHLAAEGVEMAVGTVGGITAPEYADALIRNDRADLVIVGREHLRDPYFALHAALDLGVDVPWPDQYLRAKPESR
jgi:2,4-dienoyl-CoA reductase-like NADH-dependent reductase (Old Yellow Enzyme family)